MLGLILVAGADNKVSRVIKVCLLHRDASVFHSIEKESPVSHPIHVAEDPEDRTLYSD